MDSSLFDKILFYIDAHLYDAGNGVTYKFKI